MNKQLPRFNLVNERGDYLAFNFKRFTTKRADAYWGIATGVDALIKEFPAFKKLTRISVDVEPTRKPATEETKRSRGSHMERKSKEKVNG